MTLQEMLSRPEAGMFLSLALFFAERFIEEFKDKKEKRQRIDDTTIRDYLEWLRRQNHQELLTGINKSQEQLLEVLGKIEGIEGFLDKLDPQLKNEFQDVQAILTELNSRLKKPVLSPIPLDCRSIQGDLLFRGEDLEALRRRKGDFIIAGQPGIGKTFLSYHFAKERNGKFAISESADDVIAALNDPPPVLIVDDAAEKTDLLKRLVHFRQGSNVNFQLVAICWSYEVDPLLPLMGLATEDVHSPRLITADEMADLIKMRFKEAGLSPPNPVIAEIRKQADGRPGLALRLVEIISRDRDLRALLDATAHYEMLDRAFRTLGEGNVSDILAAFAVGGRVGMHKEDVAEALDHPVRQISKVLRTLATGGIIKETGPTTLATQPSSFRHALLKKEFLTGGSLGDFDIYVKLFEKAPSKQSALTTVIDAVTKGAIIEAEWLLSEVKDVDDTGIWHRLAGTGAEWCARVIDAFDGSPDEIADCVLLYFPERIIPSLLDTMVSDVRPPNSNPDCAERQLQDWIEAIPARMGDSTERRRQLLEATKGWLVNGGDPDTGWKSLRKCVSLEYHRVEADPGAGNKISWVNGLLPAEEVKRFVSFWDEFLSLAQTYPPRRWDSLLEALREWLHPYASNGVPQELHDLTTSTAKHFAEEFVQLPNVPQDAVRMWGVDYGLWDDKKITPEFRIYNPPDPFRVDRENRRALEQANTNAAKKLGGAWAKLPPAEVAQKIHRMEEQCRQWDRRGIYDWTICQQIASEISDIPTWLKTFVEYGLSPSAVMPFVQKTMQTDPQWNIVIQLLNIDQYQPYVMDLLLQHDDIPEEVIAVCAPMLEKYTQTIETVIYRGQLSAFWWDYFMEHTNGKLALAVVLVDFRTKNQTLLKTNRKGWLNLFRRGIVGLESLDDFHDIGEMVAVIPEIRLPLVLVLLENNKYILDPYTKRYEDLSGSLSREEKREILSNAGRKSSRDLMALLIGVDTVLYKELLDNPDLGTYHLHPLLGDPINEGWQAKAILAIEAGYQPRQIVNACTSDMSWSGSEAAHYKMWVDRFSVLAASSDSRLQEIGKEGIRIFSYDQANAERRENYETIHGRSGDE